MPVFSYSSGSWRGMCVADAPWTDADWKRLIAAIAPANTAPGHPSSARNTITRQTITLNGAAIDSSIKSFRPANFWRDRYFAKKGSKAERSFRTAVRLAEAGVGTPRPIAFVDRWDGGRLEASHYFCAYQDHITNFRDELYRLYTHDPLCRRIMKLMETVAWAIADMHDAGVCHRDLGNQNILLRRHDDDHWGDVQFIDLNRADVAEQLTLAQRARDISRIDLPSDFLRVFKCMYFRHQHPPAGFHALEETFRRRFARHTATRKYRHPVREARQRKIDASLPYVPRGRELWVWDDCSVQAVSTMVSRDRKQYYPVANHLMVARAMIKAAAPVWSLYKDYSQQAFCAPVEMSGRMGIALGNLGEDEHALFNDLEAPAALLRFYVHEPEHVNEQALAMAKQLKAAGKRVMVALVQDRAAVRDASRWSAFVHRWVPALRGVADELEVGHAVNRVKWGVWDVREYRKLVEPVIEAAAGTIQLTGPAVIDFEYHYLAAFLDQVPRDAFAALSHHLYVDRRGAPENRQGKFSSVEKFALAKAFAAHSPAVRGDRLIISEVNWPILDTGVYSPVNSPYIIPNSHTNDPSVDEETYANYMIRYYALALCSGLVDQVYWWRLVARGFGLVDDATTPWRPRPAFRALQVFIRELGNARFVEKMNAPDGVWLLRFERDHRGPVLMAWSHPSPYTFTCPAEFKDQLIRDGEPQTLRGPLTLGSAPVYLLAG